MKKVTEKDKATIVCEAGKLKKFVQAVKECSCEGILSLGETGIYCRCVNTANVFMVDAQISKSELKECSVPKGSLKKIAYEWRKIERVISMASQKTPVKLVIDPKQTTLTYGEIVFTLPHMDINTVRGEPNKPSITLPTQFSFDGALLLKFKKVTRCDKIRIVVSKEGIAEIFAEEGEGKTKMFLSLDITGKKDANSIFATDYMWSIAKVLSNSCVDVSMAIDHPIKVSGISEGVDIEYLLTPWIEAD